MESEEFRQENQCAEAAAKVANGRSCMCECTGQACAQKNTVLRCSYCYTEVCQECACLTRLEGEDLPEDYCHRCLTSCRKVGKRSSWTRLTAKGERNIPVVEYLCMSLEDKEGAAEMAWLDDAKPMQERDRRTLGPLIANEHTNAKRTRMSTSQEERERAQKRSKREERDQLDQSDISASTVPTFEGITSSQNYRSAVFDSLTTKSNVQWESRKMMTMAACEMLTSEGYDVNDYDDLHSDFKVSPLTGDQVLDAWALTAIPPQTLDKTMNLSNEQRRLLFWKASTDMVCHYEERKERGRDPEYSAQWLVDYYLEQYELEPPRRELPPTGTIERLVNNKDEDSEDPDAGYMAKIVKDCRAFEWNDNEPKKIVWLPMGSDAERKHIPAPKMQKPEGHKGLPVVRIAGCMGVDMLGNVLDELGVEVMAIIACDIKDESKAIYKARYEDKGMTAWWFDSLAEMHANIRGVIRGLQERWERGICIMMDAGTPCQDFLAGFLSDLNKWAGVRSGVMFQWFAVVLVVNDLLRSCDRVSLMMEQLSPLDSVDYALWEKLFLTPIRTTEGGYAGYYKRPRSVLATWDPALKDLKIIRHAWYNVVNGDWWPSLLYDQGGKFTLPIRPIGAFDKDKPKLPIGHCRGSNLIWDRNLTIPQFTRLVKYVGLSIEDVLPHWNCHDIKLERLVIAMNTSGAVRQLVRQVTAEETALLLGAPMQEKGKSTLFEGVELDEVQKMMLLGESWEGSWLKALYAKMRRPEARESLQRLQLATPATALVALAGYLRVQMKLYLLTDPDSKLHRHLRLLDKVQMCPVTLHCPQCGSMDPGGVTEFPLSGKSFECAKCNIQVAAHIVWKATGSHEIRGFTSGHWRDVSDFVSVH